MMIAIETRGLTKKYGRKIALSNLNIKIKQGEVYGFIGRNGAGKTTTINLILSLIHASEGDVFINEKKVMFEDQSYKQVIGYVPDVPKYPGYMNAKEYLTYTCDMYDLDPSIIKEKVLEVLDFVDLRDHKKKISAYSRGMKQRLGIAQALVHDPDILIMDEPTSALDPIGRKDVMNIILKLKGQKTIFYSTHILEDVEKVCDRIGLLNFGELVLEDTIENIQKMFFNDKMILNASMKPKELKTLLESKIDGIKIEPLDKELIIQLKDQTTSYDIMKTLVDEKVTVKEYKRQTATLEDVFIKVTSEKTT